MLAAAGDADALATLAQRARKKEEALAARNVLNVKVAVPGVAKEVARAKRKEEAGTARKVGRGSPVAHLRVETDVDSYFDPFGDVMAWRHGEEEK